MKQHKLFVFALSMTALSFSCVSANKNDDLLLNDFKPSEGFGVFSAEKKAELEKRFASKEKKANDFGSAESAESKSSVFNFNSDSTAKSANAAVNNDGSPRAASVLPDRICSDIFGEVKEYTASQNKSFIVKNITVGLVFTSKQENDPDYVFIAPTTNFMVSPKTTEGTTSLKCVENGEYFDLITNLKLFTNK